MSGMYFTILAALVLVGFFLAQKRASGVQRDVAAGSLHSLPVYRGLYTCANTLPACAPVDDILSH